MNTDFTKNFVSAVMQAINRLIVYIRRIVLGSITSNTEIIADQRPQVRVGYAHV